MGFDLSKLGVKKNIPSVNFTDYSGVVVAPPKWGKTTIASMFPNSIIAPFENGVKGSVVNVIDGMRNWDDFVEFVDKLEANRLEIGSDVKSIVFDTITACWDMLESATLKYCSKKDKIKYRTTADMQLSKNGSNFWIERDGLLKRQLQRITSLGFVPIFLSHLKIKTIKPKNGESYDVYSSTMDNRLEQIIYPFVDFILTGERTVVEVNGVKTPKRVLVTRGSGMATAGSRVFMNEDIVFETEEEAMQKYQEAFAEMIKARLEDAGVTESVDAISKRQEAEKMEKVSAYIESGESISNEELIEQIQAGLKLASADKKAELKAKMNEVGILSFKAPDDLDKEGLKQLLSIF